MNRSIRILFGVVAPEDGAGANDIGAETTLCASTVTRAEVVRSGQMTYRWAASARFGVLRASANSFPSNAHVEESVESISINN